MHLLRKIKDWNVQRKYANIGVAFANILCSKPLENDPFDKIFLNKLQKTYVKCKAAYIAVGYEPIDFLKERRNYGKSISKKQIAHLLGKKA